MASDGAQTSERTDDDDRAADPDEDVGSVFTVDRCQFHVHVQLDLHPYSQSEYCNSGQLDETTTTHQIE